MSDKRTELREKWNAPSKNPDVKGATPGALARALLRPIRRKKEAPREARVS